MTDAIIPETKLRFVSFLKVPVTVIDPLYTFFWMNSIYHFDSDNFFLLEITFTHDFLLNSSMQIRVISKVSHLDTGRLLQNFTVKSILSVSALKASKLCHKSRS